MNENEAFEFAHAVIFEDVFNELGKVRELAESESSRLLLHILESRLEIVSESYRRHMASKR